MFIQEVAYNMGVPQRNKAELLGNVPPRPEHEQQKINNVLKTILVLMQRYEVPPDRFTHSPILLFIQKCGQSSTLYDEISMYLEDILRYKLIPKNFACSLLLNVCLKHFDFDRAEKFYRYFEESGVVSVQKLPVYSIFITAYSKVGEIEKAERFYRCIVDLKVVPSIQVFHGMISCAGLANDGEKVSYYFEEMKKHRIEANEFIYSSLILSCVQSGDVQKANEYYRTMMKNGITPNIHIFTNLLNVFAKVGDVREAERIYFEMKNLKIKPNLIFFNSMLQCCLSPNDPISASKFFDLMLEEKVNPSNTTLNFLLSIYSKAKDDAKVDEILNMK